MVVEADVPRFAAAPQNLQQRVVVAARGGMDSTAVPAWEVAPEAERVELDQPPGRVPTMRLGAMEVREQQVEQQGQGIERVVAQHLIPVQRELALNSKADKGRDLELLELEGMGAGAPVWMSLAKVVAEEEAAATTAEAEEEVLQREASAAAAAVVALVTPAGSLLHRQLQVAIQVMCETQRDEQTVIIFQVLV